jgi:hypothetical protein
MPLLDRFKSSLDRLRRTRRAYQQVFGTPEGQIVLHDLLARCGVLETSVVHGDPYVTHFREGRRSVGLDLLHKLRWTEGDLHQLALAQTSEQLAQTQENG